MTEYFPDTYNEITHSITASIRQEEDHLQETHTIQISTSHKYASICFTVQSILQKFCKTEHLLNANYVRSEPDYHKRIMKSIETIPVEILINRLKPFCQNIQQSQERHTIQELNTKTNILQQKHVYISMY